MSKYVLGVDPGFAHLGLALYHPATFRVAEWTVVETEKSSNKTLLAREDNADRFRVWAEGFYSFVAPYAGQIVAVCTEGMSQPRNSSAAAKLFMSWGGILMWAHTAGLGVFQIAPQDLKKDFTGKKNASKEEMILALAAYVASNGGALPAWHKRLALREHQADAAASAISLVNRVPTLKLLTKDP